MWCDWGVAIRLLIQHAFVYLTEKLGSVPSPAAASRHRLGAGRRFRNGKASFRETRAFLEIAVLDTPTSTGSCEGSGRALPFLLIKVRPLFQFLMGRTSFQERWCERSYSRKQEAREVGGLV